MQAQFCLKHTHIYLVVTKIDKNRTAFLKDHKHLTRVFFKVKVLISEHISQNMAFLLTCCK